MRPQVTEQTDALIGTARARMDIALWGAVPGAAAGGPVRPLLKHRCQSTFPPLVFKRGGANPRVQTRAATTQEMMHPISTVRVCHLYGPAGRGQA